MMPPSGPGISPKAPNLECTESALAVFPSFWYQTCNTFFHIGLGRDRRRNSKREGKVFCRSYRIFGPDSFFYKHFYLSENFCKEETSRPSVDKKRYDFCFRNLGFFSSFFTLISRMSRRKNSGALTWFNL